MEKVQYKHYIHMQSFPVKEILSLVANRIYKYFTIDDIIYNVGLCSGRLFTFKRSIICVECGRVGNIMSLDRFKKKSKISSAHFNLYCKEDNKFILMTKDHIIPKSKGGKNHVDNYQTMCEYCNCKKADK